MFDILSTSFMQNAIIAGLLASILCGVIGVLVVIRRMVFISGGISHISFGGLGIAYYLGQPHFYGALIFAFLAALTLGMIDYNKMNRKDTVIGIMWAMGMAIGILFISLTPGYAPDLTTYLFGNILTVSKADIYLLISMVIFTLVFFLFFNKEIIAVSFDKELCLIRGISYKALNTLLYIVVALTIVLLIEIVGIVLVIALLTIPPSIALVFSKSLKKLIILSIVISMILITGGLYLSSLLPIHPGASIILPGGFFFLVSRLYPLIFRSKTS